MSSILAFTILCDTKSDAIQPLPAFDIKCFIQSFMQKHPLTMAYAEVNNCELLFDSRKIAGVFLDSSPVVNERFQTSKR